MVSFLVETIQSAMPSISLEAAIEAMTNLTNQEVLELTELQMEPKQDTHLSVLLDRQQAGVLTEPECIELQSLMQIYQVGLLRKATALNEAVKRRLIEPLNQ